MLTPTPDLQARGHDRDGEGESRFADASFVCVGVCVALLWLALRPFSFARACNSLLPSVRARSESAADIRREKKLQCGLAANGRRVLRRSRQERLFLPPDVAHRDIGLCVSLCSTPHIPQ